MYIENTKEMHVNQRLVNTFATVGPIVVDIVDLFYKTCKINLTLS